MDSGNVVAEAKSCDHIKSTSLLDNTTSFSDEKASTLDPLSQQRVDDVEEACRRQDIPWLRRLAESSGGFVSDEARKIACECVIDLLSRRAALTISRIRASTTGGVNWVSNRAIRGRGGCNNGEDNSLAGPS